MPRWPSNVEITTTGVSLVTVPTGPVAYNDFPYVSSQDWRYKSSPPTFDGRNVSNQSVTGPTLLARIEGCLEADPNKWVDIVVSFDSNGGYYDASITSASSATLLNYNSVLSGTTVQSWSIDITSWNSSITLSTSGTVGVIDTITLSGGTLDCGVAQYTFDPIVWAKYGLTYVEAEAESTYRTAERYVSVYHSIDDAINEWRLIYTKSDATVSTVGVAIDAPSIGTYDGDIEGYSPFVLGSSEELYYIDRETADYPGTSPPWYRWPHKYTDWRELDYWNNNVAGPTTKDIYTKWSIGTIPPDYVRDLTQDSDRHNGRDVIVSYGDGTLLAHHRVVDDVTTVTLATVQQAVAVVNAYPDGVWVIDAWCEGVHRQWSATDVDWVEATGMPYDAYPVSAHSYQGLNGLTVLVAYDFDASAIRVTARAGHGDWSAWVTVGSADQCVPTVVQWPNGTWAIDTYVDGAWRQWTALDPYGTWTETV